MRPPRPSAPPLAAVVAAGVLSAAPAAQAQWFGLQADEPVAAQPEADRTGGWFGLRADEPDTPAAPAVRPVSHVVPQPDACDPAAYGPPPAGGFHGPIPDDPHAGGGPHPVAGAYVGGAFGGHYAAGLRAATPEPVYPPGTRQVIKDGLAWPPFPRPTGPKASWKTQLHHAHYWPFPYNCRDRAYVRGVAAAQVAAGRAEHAAVHGFHFDPVTHGLTDAGRSHLGVAVHAARTTGAATPIAVSAGPTAEASDARVAAVRRAVDEMGAPQLGAAVVLTSMPSHGRPALEIERLRKDEILSMPQPRIPVRAAGGSPQAGG